MSESGRLDLRAEEAAFRDSIATLSDARRADAWASWKALLGHVRALHGAARLVLDQRGDEIVGGVHSRMTKRVPTAALLALEELLAAAGAAAGAAPEEELAPERTPEELAAWARSKMGGDTSEMLDE